MKKLLFLLLFPFTSHALAQEIYSPYDVNRDGKVTIEDVTWLTNHLIGKPNPYIPPILSQLNGLVYVPDFYNSGRPCTSFKLMRRTYWPTLPSTSATTIEPSTSYVACQEYPNKREDYYSEGITASYHINPSNAFLDGMKLSVISNTYAAGLYVNNWKVDDGMLLVNLNATNPSRLVSGDGDDITTFAIKATIPNKSSVPPTVTSDYVGVIVENTKADTPYLCHTSGYRTTDPVNGLPIQHVTGVSNRTMCGTCNLYSGPGHLFKTVYEAAKKGYNASGELIDSNYGPQDVCLWDGTLDLRQLVDLHYTDGNDRHYSLGTATSSKAQQWLKSNGYKLVFELTGLQLGGHTDSESIYAAIASDGYTFRPQACGTDEWGVAQQQPYGSEQKRNTVGHRPLVRVSLQDEYGTVFDYGYISILIIDHEEVHFDTLKQFEVSVNAISFAKKGFCESAYNTITADQMNSVYAGLNVTKQEFVENYTQVATIEYNPKEGATKTYTTTATADNVISYDSNSAAMMWTVSATYRRKLSGQHASAAAVFVKNYMSDHEEIVVINLTSTTTFPTYDATAKDAYKLPNKIASYWKTDYSWNDGEEVAQLNVFVPSIGETDANKCVFANDLQGLFSTRILDGIKNNISADFKAGANNVIANNVSMRIKSAKCNGYPFTVAGNGTQLKCNGEVVLTYDPTTNMSVLVKTSDVVKKLLNTNAFYVTYSFYADYTTPCAGTQEVPNNGYPSFTTRYMCPLNVSNPLNYGNFEDGLDFGTYDAVGFHTTILPAANVIGISDWCGKEVKEGEYLYSYYGVKKVTCYNDEVSTDLTGTKKLLRNIRNTLGNQIIEAGIVNADVWANDNLRSGLSYTFSRLGVAEADTYDQYFYYKNNGALVEKEFNLYFPVTVEYTWGTLQAVTLKVTVKPAIH